MSVRERAHPREHRLPSPATVFAGKLPSAVSMWCHWRIPVEEDAIDETVEPDAEKKGRDEHPGSDGIVHL